MKNKTDFFKRDCWGPFHGFWSQLHKSRLMQTKWIIFSEEKYSISANSRKIWRIYGSQMFHLTFKPPVRGDFYENLTYLLAILWRQDTFLSYPLYKSYCWVCHCYLSTTFHGTESMIQVHLLFKKHVETQRVKPHTLFFPLTSSGLTFMLLIQLWE